MELNKLNLVAQNAASLNKSQGKEEAKADEKTAAEVKDNKPAEKQCSADDVFAFMAGSAVDFKAKVAKAGKAEGQEDRIAGFMAEFEQAFEAAKELGLSDEAAFKVLERM